MSEFDLLVKTMNMVDKALARPKESAASFDHDFVPFRDGEFCKVCGKSHTQPNRIDCIHGRRARSCDICERDERIKELTDALSGLYGLLQLYASRQDMPQSFRADWFNNHRAVAAREALK